MYTTMQHFPDSFVQQLVTENSPVEIQGNEKVFCPSQFPEFVYIVTKNGGSVKQRIVTKNGGSVKQRIVTKNGGSVKQRIVTNNDDDKLP